MGRTQRWWAWTIVFRCCYRAHRGHVWWVPMRAWTSSEGDKPLGDEATEQRWSTSKDVFSCCVEIRLSRGEARGEARGAEECVLGRRGHHGWKCWVVLCWAGLRGPWVLFSWYPTDTESNKKGVFLKWKKKNYSFKAFIWALFTLKCREEFPMFSFGRASGRKEPLSSFWQDRWKRPWFCAVEMHWPVEGTGVCVTASAVGRGNRECCQVTWYSLTGTHRCFRCAAPCGVRDTAPALGEFRFFPLWGSGTEYISRCLIWKKQTET